MFIKAQADDQISLKYRARQLNIRTLKEPFKKTYHSAKHTAQESGVPQATTAITEHSLSVTGKTFLDKLNEVQDNKGILKDFSQRKARQAVLNCYLALPTADKVAIQKRHDYFELLRSIALHEISDQSNLVSRQYTTLSKCAAGIIGTYEELTPFGNAGETLPRLSSDQTAEVASKLEDLKTALPRIEQEYADLIELIAIYYSANLISRDTRNMRLHRYTRELNPSKGAVLEDLNKLENVYLSNISQASLMVNKPDQRLESSNKALSNIKALLEKLPELKQKLEKQFEFTKFIHELSPPMAKPQTSAAVQESSLELLNGQFDLMREEVIKLTDPEAGKQELRKRVQTLKALLNLQETALQSSNSSTKLSEDQLKKKLSEIDDFLFEQYEDEPQEATKAQIKQINNLWVEEVISNFSQSPNDEKDKIPLQLGIKSLEKSIENLEVKNSTSQEVTTNLARTQAAVISHNYTQQTWKEHMNNMALQATLVNRLRRTS